MFVRYFTMVSSYYTLHIYLYKTNTEIINIERNVLDSPENVCHADNFYVYYHVNLSVCCCSYYFSNLKIKLNGLPELYSYCKDSLYNYNYKANVSRCRLYSNMTRLYIGHVLYATMSDIHTESLNVYYYYVKTEVQYII